MSNGITASEISLSRTEAIAESVQVHSGYVLCGILLYCVTLLPYTGLLYLHIPYPCGISYMIALHESTQCLIES